MKRLIALLIAILALIAGAGRAEVNVTSDYKPVSVEITEEQESTAETPAEATVSHVLPLEDNTAKDADPAKQSRKRRIIRRYRRLSLKR